jgi:hypothetical protein
MIRDWWDFDKQSDVYEQIFKAYEILFPNLLTLGYDELRFLM